MVANDPSTNMVISTPNQPDIMDLPPEVLVEIFNLTDNKDLPNVRLACKKLCEAANRPFGFANFTERAHVVSPYSINALVDITEHPIFGSYVKSVGICSARAGLKKEGFDYYYRMDADAMNKLILNEYVKTGRFGRRMKRVFDNVRMHSRSVTISIYNDEPDGTRFVNESCLAPETYFGWTQFIKQGPGAPAFKPAETLEQTVYAARRAGCLIKCIRMDYFSPDVRFRGEIQRRLDTTIQQVLESSITPLDFHVDGIRYHDKSASLEISEFMPKLREDTIHECPLTAFYCWAKAKKIARLRFHHNSHFNIRHFQPLLTSHLEYLGLDRLGVPCRDLDVNLWSEHIQSLCGLRGLRYCRLERLRYRCDLGWDNVSDTSWLELPDQNRYVCDYDSFHLLFRDGTKSFEAKGESVCSELKGLVCYLEASEEQKRSQIIREGLVSHDKIGIVD
ncbi:hypothetical protein D6C82_10225 [Aureobasidium pullulans]|nr:hypothetical protein D6C82_10225 [Aureobasidium pullulans]